MEEDGKGKILYEEIISDPDDQLSEVHIQRVTKMVNEYKGKIKAHLSQEQERETKWAERLADKIASFGGSWPFIIIFISFLLLWMAWNTISFLAHFDEPPYILLNLILSCVAALQAPVILMSQNRGATRDKQESMMDFAINYKAEQENQDIQSLLRRIDKRLERLEENAKKNI